MSLAHVARLLLGKTQLIAAPRLKQELLIGSHRLRFWLGQRSAVVQARVEGQIMQVAPDDTAHQGRATAIYIIEHGEPGRRLTELERRHNERLGPIVPGKQL